METYVISKTISNRAYHLPVPYWDYATKPAIPQIAATPDINVLGFDGKRVQYREDVKLGLNPMYTFQPKVIDIGYKTFGGLPEGLSLPADV